MRFHRSIYDNRPDAYVQELYVVPGRRGEGLGRALLEAALDSAREAGALHVELTTSEGDTEALSLYESSGFTNREGGPDGPRMLYYERELLTRRPARRLGVARRALASAGAACSSARSWASRVICAA